MNWELLISAIALIVSGMAAFYSFKQGRRSNQLQERIVDIEEQREKERLAKENKADLRASFKYENLLDEGQVASHIVVRNEGKIKAENIRLYVDGDPVTQHKYMMQSHSHKLSPILPDKEYKSVISVEENEPESCEIKLLWDDETGRNYEFKEKLPLKK